jgi:sn-glycerol 3-phosphate transport system ATP-binding protein
VAGIEEVTEGQVLIGGRDVTHAPPMDRDIAMVFQNYALYQHMDVAQNMSFALSLAGRPVAEVNAKVAAAAKVLNIEHLLKRKPKELSGGQRQRVAIGRAIVREPQVFLFDEPLSNLDAKLRAQTRLEIQKLHTELGVTSLFVTHDQVEAMTLAQRMVVMNAGRIEQIGTPEQVYGTPASTFVAGFIGSPPMNLMKGVASSSESGHSFAMGSQTLPLPAAAPRNGELLLGVRPEHAELAPSGWPLRVDMLEMLGAERLVYGHLGDGPPSAQPSTGSFTLRIEATLVPPARGSTVHLQVQPQHLHWFDPATGLRV